MVMESHFVEDQCAAASGANIKTKSEKWNFSGFDKSSKKILFDETFRNEKKRKSYFIEQILIAQYLFDKYCNFHYFLAFKFYYYYFPCILQIALNTKSHSLSFTKKWI